MIILILKGSWKKNVLAVYTARAFRVLAFLRKMMFTFLTECQALKTPSCSITVKEGKFKGKNKIKANKTIHPYLL